MRLIGSHVEHTADCCRSEVHAQGQTNQRTLHLVEQLAYTSYQTSTKADQIEGSMQIQQGCLGHKPSENSPNSSFVRGAISEHTTSVCLPDQTLGLQVTRKEYDVLHTSEFQLPSPLWSLQSKSRTRKVITRRGAATRSSVEIDSSYVVYPSRLLSRLGLSYGIWVQSRSTSGWQFSLQPFNAVPADAPIFQFCREGNVSELKTILSLGYASIRDRDPLGRTSLWVSDVPSLEKFPPAHMPNCLANLAVKSMLHNPSRSRSQNCSCNMEPIQMIVIGTENSELPSSETDCVHWLTF